MVAYVQGYVPPFPLYTCLQRGTLCGDTSSLRFWLASVGCGAVTRPTGPSWLDAGDIVLRHGFSQQWFGLRGVRCSDTTPLALAASRWEHDAVTHVPSAFAGLQLGDVQCHTLTALRGVALETLCWGPCAVPQVPSAFVGMTWGMC
jgi:hypothetical protein